MSGSRLDALRMYVRMLAADQAAAGKFQGKGENKIAAAADAILNGSTAIAQQLWEDLKTIGGEKAAMAAPLAEAAAAGIAADLARDGIRAGASFVRDLFAGKARAKQAQRKAAGRVLMETAAKMGGKK